MARNGSAKLAQPGVKPTIKRRGGGVGGRAEGEENLVYGLVTSQCPIVPAWIIDRIKSKLVYVSTSLSNIITQRTHGPTDELIWGGLGNLWFL